MTRISGYQSKLKNAAVSKPSWLNRRVFAWASYDVASSVYFGTVPTVLFPVFYTTVVNTGGSGFFWLGTGVSLILLLAGLTAPRIGQFADRGWCWYLLAAFTLAYCAATMMLSLVGAGDWLLAIALFAVAQCAYYLAQPLYESYLPAIANSENCGRVSAFGWASGFIGGITILIILLYLVSRPEPTTIQSAFFLVGAMTLALGTAALALIRALLDKIALPHNQPPLLRTLRDWRLHGDLFRAIAAYYFVNVALVTIAVFAASYFNKAFGISIPGLLKLMLVYTVIALPSTMLFGFVADRYSHRFAIIISLTIWTGAIILMATGRSDWIPAVVVICLGLVYGSTQSLFRSLISQYVPQGREAEFFGLNTAAGRISASVGPVLFGAISSWTGDPRWAIYSMLTFVLIGAAILFTSFRQDRISTMGEQHL